MKKHIMDALEFDQQLKSFILLSKIGSECVLTFAMCVYICTKKYSVSRYTSHKGIFHQ